ncbi:MAG: DinB family protein [Anaerolineales bacterium]|nr:DinB family protein [Anaerolineales bacterium]
MLPTDLAAALTAARAAMETALAGLPDAHYLTPGAAGPWTVKDVLAHLTHWEVDLVTSLAKFRRGQSPGKTIYTTAEINAQNARWHTESQARSLSQVQADYHGVRKQTIRQVEALTEPDLNAPRAWLKQDTIRHWVLAWVVEHEQEHAQHLTEWRRQAGV